MNQRNFKGNLVVTVHQQGAVTGNQIDKEPETALVNVVLPRMVVAPVLDPMVARPERVERLGKDVVAANLVSNLDVV